LRQNIHEDHFRPTICHWCYHVKRESLRKRFATYEEQTKPVIEKFRSASKLHEVDSTVPAADVAAAVSKIIEADSLLVKK